MPVAGRPRRCGELLGIDGRDCAGPRPRAYHALGQGGHPQPASARIFRHSGNGRSGSQCSSSQSRTSARTDSGSTPMDSILSHSRARRRGSMHACTSSGHASSSGRALDDWDARFSDDAPAYERAARELAPRPGGVVVDLGCGTGRRAPGPARRRRAGGHDHRHRRDCRDARRRVRADATAPACSSSVTCSHCRCARVASTRSSRPASSRTSPTPRRSSSDLAEWARPGGRLALFHPIGRAALAARQQRELSSADLLAPANVRPLLAGAGWVPDLVDDADQRYLVVARTEG